jgi:hypothetical protein
MNTIYTPPNRMTGFAMRGGVHIEQKLTLREELQASLDITLSVVRVLNSHGRPADIFERRAENLAEQLTLLDAIEFGFITAAGGPSESGA